MKRHALHLVSVLFILAMMFVNSAVASANAAIALPPDDGKLTETLQKVQSLMCTGDLSEANAFKKQYVDYFGGTSYYNDTVTVYTTDKEAPLIKELSSHQNIVIKKVTHSLNELNQLALDLVALGQAGRINGYDDLTLPVVNVRKNRVDLSLWDTEPLPDGLSPEVVMREVKADSKLLHIHYNENYPVVDGAVQIPKTGDAPYEIDYVIFSLVVAGVCMVLFASYVKLNSGKHSS